jgi:hypothetical protein
MTKFLVGSSFGVQAEPVIDELVESGGEVLPGQGEWASAGQAVG